MLKSLFRYFCQTFAPKRPETALEVLAPLRRREEIALERLYWEIGAHKW